MILFGLIWSFLVLHGLAGLVLSCFVFYSLVWSCLVFYDLVWSSMVLYDLVWSCMVLFSSVCSCIVFFCLVWSNIFFMILYRDGPIIGIIGIGISKSIFFRKSVLVSVWYLWMKNVIGIGKVKILKNRLESVSVRFGKLRIGP